MSVVSLFDVLLGVETYMVTLLGSPPNAEMYFCTHLKAWRSSHNTHVPSMAHLSSVKCSKILTVLQTQVGYPRCFDLSTTKEAKG